MPRLDPDQEALKALGIEAFGPEPWHAKLARLTNVSRSYISQICRGDKNVTPAVDSAIRAGIRREIKRLRAALNTYEEKMRGNIRE